MLPEKVRELIRTLRTAGFEAFAVGGCVRDSLLGRTPNDWDVTTSASPQEVKALFPRTVDTGLKHGTVTVLLDKEAFEVTTYRLDGTYQDGRHPDQVRFTQDLAEDLRRRDLTINAMAYDEEQGLVDLYGGCQDLADRVIRCVGDPKERFSEDHLRILRAVRFAAQLGFTIEEETCRAMAELSSTLAAVSAERIQMELVKLLTSPHPEYIRICYEAGMTAVFLPEFDRCMETPQANPHHGWNVGEHTIRTLTAAPPDRVLRLTMLLHDIGKPETRSQDERGVDHFYGHAAKGAGMARKVLKRLRFDNRTTDQVELLVRHHDERPELSSEASVRRAVAKCTPAAFPALFEVMRADVRGKAEDLQEEMLAWIDGYEAVWRKITAEGQCLSQKDLAVNGGDLMREGVPQGKRVGKALREALAFVLEDPSRNERQTILEFLRKRKYLAAFWILPVLLALPGCGLPVQARTSASVQATEASSEELLDPEEVRFAEGTYIFCGADTAGETVRFRDPESGEERTYPYGSGTMFYDKYGGVSYLAAFAPGDPVTYGLTPYGKLAELRADGNAFRVEECTDFSVDRERGIFTLEGSNYKVDPTVPVFLGDYDVTLAGLGEGDEITVCGLDRSILSVRITTGTGTIVLQNTAMFDGSLLNLDSQRYLEVEPGMEIPAREGIHQLTVAKDGYGDSVSLQVLRGQSTAVDLGALRGEGPKWCSLILVTLPGNARVTLDGAEVDQSAPIAVQYGSHRLEVTAEGYEPWGRNLVANSATATITVALTDTATGEAASGSSVKSEPREPNAAEIAASEAVEAARNGTRPESPGASSVVPEGAVSGSAADRIREAIGSRADGIQTGEDFNEVYLDTLTEMLKSLLNSDTETESATSIAQNYADLIG